MINYPVITSLNEAIKVFGKDVILSNITQTHRRLSLSIPIYGPHSISKCPYKSHIDCTQKEKIK